MCSSVLQNINFEFNRIHFVLFALIILHFTAINFKANYYILGI